MIWPNHLECGESRLNQLTNSYQYWNEAFEQKGPCIIGVPVDYSENMKLTKHLGKVSAIL